MNEVGQNERVLIYDVSLNKFPEYVDEAEEFGKEIVLRHGQAQERLIDVSFKKVFGIDMNAEENAMCNAITQADDSVIIFHRGRPFLQLGEMVHEDILAGDERRRKIYLEYKVML